MLVTAAHAVECGGVAPQPPLAVATWDLTKKRALRLGKDLTHCNANTRR